MADFDLQKLSENIQKIEDENKQYDSKLFELRQELVNKKEKLNEILVLKDDMRRNHVQVRKELLLCHIAQDEVEIEFRAKRLQLEKCVEAIAEAEVELRRQEALSEYWQMRKFDAMEEKRQKIQAVRDKIDRSAKGKLNFAIVIKNPAEFVRSMNNIFLLKIVRHFSKPVQT